MTHAQPQARQARKRLMGLAKPTEMTAGALILGHVAKGAD
jgi:hypothetical protein